MSEEMSLAARELREKQSDARVQALSNAIVLLTRYFDYVQLKNRTLPALLIGGINELRRAGGKALIQESHFSVPSCPGPETRQRLTVSCHVQSCRPWPGACVTCIRPACWVCCEI